MRPDEFYEFAESITDAYKHNSDKTFFIGLTVAYRNPDKWIPNEDKLNSAAASGFEVGKRMRELNETFK